MVGMTLIIFLCSFLGLLIFANYYDCDPVGAGIVSSGKINHMAHNQNSFNNFCLIFRSSADQLLPLFVVDVLRDYPSLPGTKNSSNIVLHKTIKFNVLL